MVCFLKIDNLLDTFQNYQVNIIIMDIHLSKNLLILNFHNNMPNVMV